MPESEADRMTRQVREWTAARTDEEIKARGKHLSERDASSVETMLFDRKREIEKALRAGGTDAVDAIVVASDLAKKQVRKEVGERRWSQYCNWKDSRKRKGWTGSGISGQRRHEELDALMEEITGR